jgi:aminoglycoside phosphotransferase (APT) family kinase protein
MTDPESEAETIARLILDSTFGLAGAPIVPVEGGLANQVFEAASPDGPIVLRMGPASRRRDVFNRERCVIARVREAGLPVPDVLGHGVKGTWAYMVVRRMDGESATHHPKRLDILRETARLAARRVHTIATIGFGFDFALEGLCGGGQVSWRGWLEDHLEANSRLEFLRSHDVISSDQLTALRDTLEEVIEMADPPVLNHGDLRLKNVLVDGDGTIVGLIDWENCVSAAGPHWDLSVALHDLNADEKEAFLDGYGLSVAAAREFAPVWRLFNALNYVREVRRLLSSNDEVGLERVRNRFRGALDLYLA